MSKGINSSKMKIAKIEALHFRLPVVREIADGTQDCLLIQVHTDTGIIGLGEVVSCSYVARAVIEAPRSAPFRHGLATIVEGMLADEIDLATQAMIEGSSWYGPGGVVRQAMSGVDMALWDIRGKTLGQPVRNLLSQTSVDQVPCYASVLWPDHPEEIAVSAESFLEQGYQAVKYGWGPMGLDPVLDESLVASARDALGPEIDLMVDAGRVWDVETACSRAEQLKKYNLLWLEEPLNPYDIKGYRELSTNSSIPIASGEILTLQQDFKQLIIQGKVAIVQPDLGRIGGFSAAQKIGLLAQDARSWAVPHAFGTGVLLAASAQWAATRQKPLTEFTRAPSPLAQELVLHDMKFEDGMLTLSNAPGLGITLNDHVAEKYRVS